MTGSLTRSNDPVGSNPARHVRPSFFEVEKPFRSAPPSRCRPDWKTVATVEPNEKLSGSTCVSRAAPANRAPVPGDPAADGLAVGSDRVQEIRVDEVASAAAGNRILASPGR
jgi:hypothetical protein